MSNKLASLRRDLDHIRKHRTDIIAQRSRLATRLSELNRELRAKKISYEIYESKFKYLLGGKTSEEKKKYFKKRLIAIKHREKDLLSRIKHETHTINSKTKTIAIAAAMLVLFVPLVSSGITELTGFASSVSSTTASAVVSEYFAISLESSAVAFGAVDVNTFIGNNATNNYNSSNSYKTEYNTTLSADSNTVVNICIRGTDLTDGGNTITVGNIYWADSSSTSSSLPAFSSKTALTASDVTMISSLAVGSSNFERYWINPPDGTSAGSYTGTFTITGKTSSC